MNSSLFPALINSFVVQQYLTTYCCVKVTMKKKIQLANNDEPTLKQHNPNTQNHYSENIPFSIQILP